MNIDKYFAFNFSCKQCGDKKYSLYRIQRKDGCYRVLICKNCNKKHLHKEAVVMKQLKKNGIR